MHFLDERFWLAISFCIFVYLAYRPIKRAILGAIDAKILDIKTRILEAEKINHDASLLFKEVQKQVENLSNIREQVLREGQEATDILVAEHTKNIEDFLERKKKETLCLIQTQKSKASLDIQAEFTDKILKLVAIYLTSSKERLDDVQVARQLMDNTKDFLD